MTSDLLGKVWNEDCLETMKRMEDKSVDLIVTDPPYFQPAFHYAGTRNAGAPKKTLGDLSILQTYFDLLFREIDRLLSDAGTIYVFCDGQSYPIMYRSIFPFCTHVRPLIWDRMVSFNGYTWRHQHEIIAWGEREATERIPTGDGDVLQCRGVLQDGRLHPAQKPVELIERLISKYTRKTDAVVYDPFLGSGTTAVACERLGRKWIGSEINPDYCKIAEKRIAAERAQTKLAL
jgi:site-specific DNA-methyltransferase (adenine-specific)